MVAVVAVAARASAAFIRSRGAPLEGPANDGGSLAREALSLPAARSLERLAVRRHARPATSLYRRARISETQVRIPGRARAGPGNEPAFRGRAEGPDLFVPE